MRFFVFALLAFVVQSIKLRDAPGRAPALMRDVSLVQSTLSVRDPDGPSEEEVNELIDALRGAVADDKEMDLDQFKDIVFGWLEKHHDPKEVDAHRAEIEEMLEHVFKHVDADGSGKVSAGELEDALKHME